MRTGWCFVLLFVSAAVTFAHPARAEDPAVSRTTLTVTTTEAGARTRETLAAHVALPSGAIVSTGVVTFRAGNLDLGSAFLNAEGNASVDTSVLPAGDHSIVATYQGQASTQASVSQPQQVRAVISTVAGFTVSATPSSLTTAAGGFVSSTVTVTPVNGFSGYVSLSCEGLPINATCTFTPVSVLAACTTTVCTAATSVMQIQTQAPSPGSTANNRADGSMLRFAFVLPGLLGLVGLGASRQRGWRALMMVLVVFAGSMSMTGCAARYRYLNHGPPDNVGTTVGSYTVVIESQSSTGSTTITPPTNPQIALSVTAAK